MKRKYVLSNAIDIMNQRTYLYGDTLLSLNNKQQKHDLVEFKFANDSDDTPLSLEYLTGLLTTKLTVIKKKWSGHAITTVCNYMENEDYEDYTYDVVIYNLHTREKIKTLELKELDLWIIRALRDGSFLIFGEFCKTVYQYFVEMDHLVLLGDNKPSTVLDCVQNNDGVILYNDSYCVYRNLEFEHPVIKLSKVVSYSSVKENKKIYTCPPINQMIILHDKKKLALLCQDDTVLVYDAVTFKYLICINLQIYEGDPKFIRPTEDNGFCVVFGNAKKNDSLIFFETGEFIQREFLFPHLSKDPHCLRNMFMMSGDRFFLTFYEVRKTSGNVTPDDTSGSVAIFNIKDGTLVWEMIEDEDEPLKDCYDLDMIEGEHGVLFFSIRDQEDYPSTYKVDYIRNTTFQILDICLNRMTRINN